jgi:Methyltransferase domain
MSAELDRGISELASRDELPGLLNAKGLLGVAVEVGVKLGKFSEIILRGWKGRRLISVDPWLEAPRDEYRDVANIDQSSQNWFYTATQKRLADFGERSEIWRMTSAQAAERVDPASIDFVYIDARHDYESVLEDVGLWHPKVRAGGMLAGHDYLDGELPAGRFGVKSAVDEFCAERGLEVVVTTTDEWPTWVIEIPATEPH